MTDYEQLKYDAMMDSRYDREVDDAIDTLNNNPESLTDRMISILKHEGYYDWFNKRFTQH